MSSDETAPYSPPSPYNTGASTPLPAPRTPRRGPLSSRLEARARLTPLVDGAAALFDPAMSPESFPGVTDTGELWTDPGSSGQAGQVGQAWTRVTSALRLPDQADGALRDTPSFGARWTSRADMLGACLDEYYQLTAKFNEARILLKEMEEEIAPLRQQQLSAHMTLRELEARLEMHSRTELRTAYLGAAEIEIRVFRAEQERDLLTSRVETLESFMSFLSRVISTIRGIPAEAMEQLDSVADAEQTFEASSARSESGAGGAGVAEAGEYEELVIDADEAAELVAQGDVEVIGAVDDADVAGGEPSERSGNDAASDRIEH